jgi:8-oxo-dGTP diphosphatase
MVSSVSQPVPSRQPDGNFRTPGEVGAGLVPGLVVGAAIVADGRVLAARRAPPHPLAGRWEFPGGKVKPEEQPAAALRRELAEELGVEASVGRTIGPTVAVPGGRRLTVHLAGTDKVPTGSTDHDELRWVGPEEIGDLDWLDPDWPIVAAVREHLLDGIPLPGGAVGGAVLVAANEGWTVRRPAGAWTPTIHALLETLVSSGVPCVPRPRGLDERGREVLEYLPGEVVGGDAAAVPRQFTDPAVVTEVGAWLRRMHDATDVTLVDRGASSAGGALAVLAQPRVWRRGRLALSPPRVVCHNDIGPRNVVLDASGHLTGVIDWDMAAPGVREDDLAFAAWQFGLGHGLPVAEEAVRVRALAAGYGARPLAVLDRVVPRMRGALRAMRAGADSGDAGMASLMESEIPGRVREQLDRLRGRLPELRSAVQAATPSGSPPAARR